jgi:hypothetical protein
MEFPTRRNRCDRPMSPDSLSDRWRVSYGNVLYSIWAEMQRGLLLLKIRGLLSTLQKAFVCDGFVARCLFRPQPVASHPHLGLTTQEIGDREPALRQDTLTHITAASRQETDIHGRRIPWRSFLPSPRRRYPRLLRSQYLQTRHPQASFPILRTAGSRRFGPSTGR